MLESFDDTAGVPHSDGIARDVTRHHRACTDGHIVADGHASQDGYRAPDPHVITNRHWQRPLAPRIALQRVSAVAGRIDAHIGTDKAIIADGHQRLVQYCEVEVGEEPLANADVLAIVAVERLVNQDLVVAHMPQQRLEHRGALSPHRRQQLIVAVDDILTLIQLLQQFSVDSAVGQSRQHFLFLGHSLIMMIMTTKIQKNQHDSHEGC